MLKKLVSALIIFSILFPDVAHCGSIWGKESAEDEGEHSPLTVKRQSIQDNPQTKRKSPQVPSGNTGTPGEETPLVFSGHSDPTFIPGVQVNFLDVAREQSLQGGESLPAWPHVNGVINVNDKEEESSSSEEIVIGAARPDKAKQGPHPTLSNDPKAVDSEDGKNKKPENLPVEKDKIGSGSFKPGDPKGKEPRTTLESDQGGSQDDSELNFRTEAERNNAYNQQSWGWLRQLQEEKLIEGELTSFSGNPNDKILSSEQILAEVKGWLKNSNPDYPDIVLALSSLDDPHVGSASKKCLNHINERIIKEKLNKKQMASILLGLVTGVGVGYITLVNFIGLYTNNLNILFEGSEFTIFIGSIVPIFTLAIDAASRTSSLVMDFMGDNIQPFSIQKTNNHLGAVIISKICLYSSAAMVSILPGYYLYLYIVCPGIKEDECVEQITFSKTLLFEFLFSTIVLDTILHYGHQLSHHVEHRINDYFFHKMREGLPLSATEIKRQKYLKKLKDLKRMIYGSVGDELGDLYAAVFKQTVGTIAGESDKDIEEMNIKEALRILRIFNTFHRDHINGLAPENSESWKTTAASWGGYGLTLLATVGRHLAFWYVVDEMLAAVQKKYGLPSITRDALSIVFGGVIAGVIQGFIEKDAIEAAIYDMLRGKKIPAASSHYCLRLIIKIWDYYGGSVGALPLIFAGINAVNGMYPPWPLWAKIACLVPFGLADMFNNAIAFHDSNLNILNGFDSAMSYFYAFEGYKKDRLIRITRQLRGRFKELRPDVLETVDRMLNGNQGNLQQMSLQLDDFEEL